MVAAKSASSARSWPGSGGASTTASASTPWSAAASASRSPNSCAPATGPTSRGYPSAITSPLATQAAAASVVSAGELPTTPTRGPPGSGWVASSAPTSKSSPTVSTRITPERANSARTDAGSRPRSVLPGGRTGDATATIGLFRPMPRASRANLRGLPKDSRYSRITSVPGSSRQYCSRSLPDTSARLPAETNVDRPRPRRSASASSATPSAPDWLKNPIRPGAGSRGANVALSRTAGSVLAMPRQFGPTTRMPPVCARRISSACAAAPAGPASAKPALTTTSACSPARAASSTTSSIFSGGTATTARSSGTPASAARATAPRPPTRAALGWTGTIGPAKPPSRRCPSTAAPTPWPLELAPYTATPRGASSRAIDRASVRCSRRHCTSSELSVGAMGKARCTTPSAYLRSTSYPKSANTRSMVALAGSTSATNRVMPVSRAAAARCSINRGPIPRPWYASSTTKATSASPASGPSRSYRPIATIRPPTSTTNASRSRWSTVTKRCRSRSGIRGYGEK